MKQEKVIKQLKKNDNYVRNTGSQRKSKDAKKKNSNEQKSLPTIPTLSNINPLLLL
jgi:hypothetical protein